MKKHIKFIAECSKIKNKFQPILHDYVFFIFLIIGFSLFIFSIVRAVNTPVVSSTGAISTTSTSTTLVGSIDNTGGLSITTRGFEYGITNSYGLVVSTTTAGDFGAGSFTINLSSIACNTTYHFRSFATNSSGSASSTDQTFTTGNTDPSCGKITYTYTNNNRGAPATIHYNGQIYTTNPGGVMTTAVFKSSTGTTSQPSLTNIVKSLGSGPDYSQQIFRSSLSDSFTIKTSYSTTSSQTLKVDMDITNNDATDTLDQVGLSFFFELITPGKAWPNDLFFTIGKYNQPSIFLNGDWGTMTLFTDDFSKNSTFGSVWSTNYSYSQYPLLFHYQNSTTPGGTGNTKTDSIAPGQTYRYTYYLRFGLPTDTRSAIASEGYSAFRSTYPYLVNWPDRSPVTRWFMSDGSRSSLTNPRGYLSDPNLDVSNQSNFNTLILNKADDIVNRMNVMNPKPQGIVIWDLEGQEFFQYFTYVGYPNKLHDLAPEMDAVADQMFQKFTNAGYKIGITLRPSDFQTGTTTPSTCTYNATNVDARDVFIKTDAVYPYRGYTCMATDTWVQEQAKFPYHQHSPVDDITILANLESKVAYAKSRWGCKYVLCR